MSTTYVLAANRNHFNGWLIQQEEAGRTFANPPTYLTRPDELRGVGRGVEVLVLPGWSTGKTHRQCDDVGDALDRAAAAGVTVIHEEAT
jgi:hypothetical protein